MIWGYGYLCTPCLGSGGHQLICQAFWCLSVHPLSQSLGKFLLDWIFFGCLLCIMLLYLFCSFIMSEASTTTATTTTPLVMVVSSGLLSLSSVTVAPSFFMGLPATLGQCDVVLLPPLTPRCSGGVVGLATFSEQQPPSLMTLQAYANYAMDSLGRFSF